MKIYVLLLALSALVADIAYPQTAQRNDVVIDEIMADPTPHVDLPDIEWIELRNTSSFNISLAGWRIVKGAGQSGAFTNYVLKPDSFVIICTGSAMLAMSAFGPTISVTNFPTLNNDEDLIYLKSNENKVICAISYKDTWYKNELKKAGGWSLEMIDTKNSCSGMSNWNAGNDKSGGTPGKINSTDGINPDDTPPRLLRAFATDSITLTMVYDEPLDTLSGAMASNYSISDGVGIPLTASAVAPLFDRVNLKVSTPLVPAKVYTVKVAAVADCSGNTIGTYNTAKAGLPDVPMSTDVVINEVLFNPSADGVDYAEVYNRSTKIIDLKQLYIANRNSTGVLGSIQQLSPESNLVFPGDFVVVTEDAMIIQQKYLTTNAGAFVQLPVMPSFPDDKGDVIILNSQGNILDEVKYYDKWHFELITNSEGVSLERIDYNAPSVQSNFHSAASSVGFGTPGYKNSQFRIDAQLPGEVSVIPAVFSPDNDGNDDFATINYLFPAQGFVTNITIFNASGTPVRYLQRNALCGVNGYFRWDGLGEKHEKLSQGIYIVFMEIFNSSGKKKQFKHTIVLARKA